MEVEKLDNSPSARAVIQFSEMRKIFVPDGLLYCLVVVDPTDHSEGKIKAASNMTQQEIGDMARQIAKQADEE